MKTGESPLRFFVRIFGRESLAVHVNDAIAILKGLRGQKERHRQKDERKELREMIQPMAMPGPHLFSLLTRAG